MVMVYVMCIVNVFLDITVSIVQYVYVQVVKLGLISHLEIIWLMLISRSAQIWVRAIEAQVFVSVDLDSQE